MAGDPLDQSDELLEHLVRMAKTPGWREHAWHAAKHYGELDPYHLQGMRQKLKDRMLKEKEQQQ